MNVDSGLDAVISAFIRYPEMSSIKCEAKNNTVSMEIILKGHVIEKQQRRFIDKSKQSLALFHRLHESKPGNLEVIFTKRRDINILTFKRDLSSLCEDEIELFIELANQEFASVLLTDLLGNYYSNESYRDFRNSVMQKISRERNQSKKVFAYRDGGKMFIYDN